MDHKKLLIVGVHEACEILGVSKQYIHQLVNTNKLKPFRILACGRIFLYEDVYKLKKEKDKKSKTDKRFKSKKK